ncbi:hypothetical protein [Phyllobacterium myrsinacearum]|uniref:Uncharacterized protein n=1 Tax=Phyllobacterium myrsinacearum TaxID=28101 RepID=A0A839EG91_9HYPH|nr:hypothetical protein [Phyllobacterium myrsinacearum]MBA8876614.1 hypothetical protein [Phyllobacterium myrsinacearum]
MTIPVSTDAAILAKFIHLDPKPIAVKWSVSEKGEGEVFGPSDSSLYALLTYADADFAKVAAKLASGQKLPAASVDVLPPWLSEEADLKSFKTNTGYDFTGQALPADPYLASPYSDGFAVTFSHSRTILVYGFSR